jgi:Shugoshin N-terminal coiled-coil region/Shugoshin C terminus
MLVCPSQQSTDDPIASSIIYSYSLLLVKRRFIRQNREIARVNSTQSLRIRNLEAEISRLLAENIAIREQAINSAQEAERLRCSQRIFRDVSRLKDQLESKLSEVSTLVTELGALPEKAKRRSSQHQRRRSGLVQLVKSPDQKEWKNRQTLGGVVAGERQLPDGRLPVIVEGKHYPRNTLESVEISRLLDDDVAASESPELGPPPIAHFDVAEPISFPAPIRQVSGTGLLEASYENRVDDVKPLPDNLERRRRRRASALLEDMSSLNISAAVSNTAEERMSLKSGAKRKLDVREDDCIQAPRPRELDDFAFQRKAAASETSLARPKGSRFTKSRTAPIATDDIVRDPATKLEPPARKVLAPMSTNSPSKSRTTGVDDKIGAAKGEGQKKINGPVNDSPKQVRPEGEDVAVAVCQEPHSTEPPPKTPAGLDLFSPVSTEPSARNGQQSEVALTASVEDVLGGTDGRTSRRARGAVSYAEPSLRAKMRRPTKELAPAVGDQTNGFKAQQRDSSARAESQERRSSHELSLLKMRTVNIKREKAGEESMAWKGLPEAQEEPSSPLLNKQSASEPKKSLDTNQDSQHLEAALDSLSIFEGPNSSPQNSPHTITAQSRHTSRRHSSKPASLRRVGQEDERTTHSNDQAPSKGTASGVSEGPPRPNSAAGMNDRPTRPSSAASLRKESTAREEKVGIKRSASVMALKSAATANLPPGNSAPSAAGTGPARIERAAVRRRSMMT